METVKRFQREVTVISWCMWSCFSGAGLLETLAGQWAWARASYRPARKAGQLKQLLQKFYIAKLLPCSLSLLWTKSLFDLVLIRGLSGQVGSRETFLRIKREQALNVNTTKAAFASPAPWSVCLPLG